MSKKTMKEYKYELSVRQTVAADLLFDNDVQEVLYGGAKGGGKSVLLCYSAIMDADYIIKLCKINTVPRYPWLIGFLGRLQAVDFNDTTLETWKKLISPDLYEIRSQDKEIVLFGGKVKFAYGGLDSQENVKKFNSAELPRIKIDQAEELTRDQAAMLRGTQGRSTINGIVVPCNILWTANPGECFLKEDFNPQCMPDVKVEPYRRFVQALPQDNTFIDSKKYVERLRDAWKHHPDILKAYVEGDWSSTAGGGFLFSHDRLMALTKLDLPLVDIDKVWVSNDPAWLGEKTDEIVDYVFRGNRSIDSHFAYNQETTQTAANSVKLCRQYRGSAIGIDAIGIGAGVTSDCRALVDKKEIDIIAINSAVTPELDDSKDRIDQNKVRFLNIRAEQYWTAAEEMNSNKWVIPNDPELIRQLCAVKYEIKNGKIKIEDKKEIKARIGRSPDRADAWVQGIWMKRFVKYKLNDSAESGSRTQTHKRRY
jgi:phage terminase large subunit